MIPSTFENSNAGLPITAPLAHQHEGSGSFEKFINMAVITTGLVAAAVIAAPLALPALGIGENEEAELLKACCKRIEEHSGITETITKAIEKIPVVGTYLNLASPDTSTLTKILVPSATILTSGVAGSLVQDYEKKHERSGIIGTAIKATGMAVGVVLSLPVLLPGLAHGVMFLGDVTGAKNIGTLLAEDIGTNYCAVKGPNPVTGEAVTQAYSAVTGAEVSAGMLAGHLGCFVPALFTAAAPAGKAALNELDRMRGKPGDTVAITSLTADKNAHASLAGGGAC